MPFTPAHAVAALPFRKSRLCFPAVVIGTLSPDFEYFLRLSADGLAGHTIAGLFWFDLPLSLAVLLLWRRYISKSLIVLAPGLFPIRRSHPELKPSGLLAKQLALASMSVLIGAVTHLVWDSFTHPVFWPYRHISLLRHAVPLGATRSLPVYKLLQHGSTLLGLFVLLTLWVRWIRSRGGDGLRSVRRGGWLLLLIAAAFGLVRVLLGVRFAEHVQSGGIVLSNFVVSFSAALFVALVLYGLSVQGKVGRGVVRS